MRIVIQIVVFAIVGVLIWLLIDSIREPITFQNEYDARQRTVVNRLEVIQDLQQMHRGLRDEYAKTFDTLTDVLRNGRFPVLSVTEDPANPGVFRYDTVRYVPAIDSAVAVGASLLNSDEMSLGMSQQFDIVMQRVRKVPYNDEGLEFEMKADTITYQQVRGVPVVQVLTPVNSFMGKYAGPKYKKYDRFYNPDDDTEFDTYYIGFGSMRKPSTSGNWEN